MNRPPAFQAVDHLHLRVCDRTAAEAWYGRALNLKRVHELAHWAAGGPLMLSDTGRTVNLALFEGAVQPHHATIALRVDAAGLAAWRAHLAGVLGRELAVEDHGESLSIYFSDPDGNPFEITTYEVATA